MWLYGCVCGADLRREGGLPGADGGATRAAAAPPQLQQRRLRQRHVLVARRPQLQHRAVPHHHAAVSALQGYATYTRPLAA